jgi:hypothetical protein
VPHLRIIDDESWNAAFGAQQSSSDNFWNKGHKHDGDANPRCDE